MPEINDRYVDVDFTQEPEYVFGDLGGGLFTDAPRYGDVVPTLTDAEIRAAIERKDAEGIWNCNLVTRVYNQRSEGSCVGNAGGQGCEVLQAEQFGKDAVVPLSAISLYKQIGRSANSGATISDCLEAITMTGILPLDTAENRDKYGGAVMPHVGFNSRYPADWKLTARLFRVSEFFAIRSVSELLSALTAGHPVQVGREGHSILYLDVMLNSRGSFIVKYVNSWGEWGDAGGDFGYGFGYDTINQINKSASWAFAMRGIKAPGGAA